jgi:hypothetical protein
MAQQIEQKTVFQIPRTETCIEVVDLPANIQLAAEMLADRTVGIRKLRWSFGQFNDLTERATEKFVNVAPKCNPEDCRQQIELMMTDVHAEDMTLTVSCPSFEFATEEEATAKQAHCESHHDAVQLAFGAFVRSSSRVGSC